MTGQTSEPAPVVVVIDDDSDVREALEGLFRSVGLAVELFASVQAYLERTGATPPSCLVLDVRLPGKSGLEFQEDLNAAGSLIPIVFISGHADVAMGVRAIKAGAIEFLTKPVRDQELLDAVQAAIARDRALRFSNSRREQVRADYQNLTTREREVLNKLVSGQRNKQIAGELGITEATVKLHRSHLMQKLNAASIVDLVRLLDACQRDGTLDESLG